MAMMVIGKRIRETVLGWTAEFFLSFFYCHRHRPSGCVAVALRLPFSAHVLKDIGYKITEQIGTRAERRPLIFLDPGPPSPTRGRISIMPLDFLKPVFSSFSHLLRNSRRSSSQTMPQNLRDINVNPDESRDQLQTVAPPVLTSSSEPSAPISETDPRDWTYIAEGGSTIVFSYDGPRNLHFDGTVIRLRKSLLRPRSDSVPPIPNEKDADDPTVDFQEHVISRLVPAEFLPHLEHVQVERAWLEKMVSIHDEKRPTKRRAKDRIDLERTRAVLATDLIGSKGWAMEIKVCLTSLHHFLL